MLLLQLLQPVLGVFGGESLNAQEQVTEFTGELQTVLLRASEQTKQTEEEIRNTATAVAEKAEDGYGQKTSAMPETEAIRVEVGPIELE